MQDSLGFGVTFVALVCVGVGSTSGGASAITAEVARKCDVLTMHAFPPRVVGNPAAGSTRGNGLDEQSYFKKCVANGATCLVTLDGSERSEGLRARPRPRAQLYALEITPCLREGAQID
jgi:hypothetical protein